jgi:hypothetical protein
MGFMQQTSTVRIPQTRAELDALVAQRGELQNQLRTLEERRVVLGDQMSRTKLAGPALMQRLETIDHRSTQLETQLAHLEEAIAAALANPELIQGRVPSADVAVQPGRIVTNFPGVEGHIFLPDGRHVVANVVDIGIGAAVSGLTMLLVGVIAWRYMIKRLTSIARGGASDTNITRLQQSMDAIAIEVERISENQRYVTKVLNERLLNAGSAERVQVGSAEERESVKR